MRYDDKVQFVLANHPTKIHSCHTKKKKLNYSLKDQKQEPDRGLQKRNLTTGYCVCEFPKDCKHFGQDNEQKKKYFCKFNNLHKK